jgi:hypothetical protein
MKRSAFASAVAWACLVAAAGQIAYAQAPSGTPLEQKRLAYYKAYRTWREADPNLEHDLATAAASGLHRRIAEARSKALAYTRARMDYYNELLAGYSAVIAKLGDPSQPLELDDAIAGLKAHQAALAKQTAAMSRELKALENDPQKTLQKQAADRQWGALAGLQTKLAEQLRQLEETVASSAASGRLRVLLLRHYQAAAALLRQETGFTRQEGALWQAYYDSLARALGNHRRPAETAPAPTASKPVRRAAPTTREPAAPVHGDSARWAGDWTYRKLKTKTYFGARPEFAKLQVTLINGFAQGYYTARYKLPKGVEGSPDVAFSFGGKLIAGDRQRFPLRSADGLTGTIEIRSLGPDAVEVVWSRVTAGKQLAFADEILQRQ